MNNLFIATSSFGEFNNLPLKILKKNKINYLLNPLKRKLNDYEIRKFASKYKFIIAGTENYSYETINNFKNLKLIYRLGSGLDNLDLNALKEKNIKLLKSKVTLDKSVAELVVGLIISNLRKIISHNNNVKRKVWKKEMGNLLYGKTVGIVGYGKIGRYLHKILKNFGVKVIINDKKNINNIKNYKLTALVKESDIISIHTNYNNKNKNLFSKNILKKLKKNCLLINTSRPEILDYDYLEYILKNNKISGACLDVYSQEPYYGKLTKLNNVILTPHIGSYASEIRTEMELEAVESIVNFMKNV